MATQDESPGRIGGYNVIESIGRGGMGVVYKARQPGLDRFVAVKMILDGQFASPEERRRFQTEAAAAGNLDHPGIVSIHEIGEDDGRLFYSMDYVEGPTLADLLNREPIPQRQAAGLLEQLATAVTHAHARDVIHRDLKPSNILLDADGRPRIADFGLARHLAADSSLTRSGQILGTPEYMAPEQAAGARHDVGRASDIYALGAILYEMLTGRPPFRGESPTDVLRRVIEDLPPPPRALNPAVDRELEAICLKCLEKRPGERYESAAALAEDLRRYQKGDPISARARSFGRALRHWARRPHRVPEAATIILVIAAFYGLWSVFGLGMLLFEWVPLSKPAHAAIIVVLDFSGFALCLPVGLGMLARKRWVMWGGLLVGCGMLLVILAFVAAGFEAGGLLIDPFQRFSIYAIFGFVACLMIAACIVALISHGESERADAESRIVPPGSTQHSADLATTAAMEPGLRPDCRE